MGNVAPFSCPVGDDREDALGGRHVGALAEHGLDGPVQGVDVGGPVAAEGRPPEDEGLPAEVGVRLGVRPGAAVEVVLRFIVTTTAVRDAQEKRDVVSVAAPPMAAAGPAIFW